MVDTCSFMAGTSDSLLQNKLLSAVMRTWPEVWAQDWFTLFKKTQGYYKILTFYLF